jgi:IPT/TIG domain
MKPLYRQPLTDVIVFSLVLISCSKHAASPLAVDAMNPTSGPDSTQVTIAGTGFSTTPTDDLVSFNGKPATVLSATSTSLIVRTPTLAGTGNVTVTVNDKIITAGLFTYDTTWMGTTITDTILAPTYLSIDNSGNVYVSSLGSSAVYKIDPSGAISTFAAIFTPTGSAFDASGNLYVVSDGDNIYKVSPAGTVTLIATDPGALWGLAMGQNGNFYAANQNDSSVDMISPQGVVSIYDSNAPNCSGLAINNGKLYVTASVGAGIPGSWEGTIFSMTQPEITSPVTSGFDYDGLSQLTFDNSSNLYATVYDNANFQGNVIRISPDGTVTNLSMPNIPYIFGIVADASGHLYVTTSETGPLNYTGAVVKLTMH